MRYSVMSTFAELRVEAERDIRAHIRRAGGDTTNYFVAQGAALVASVRLWGPGLQKTDTDGRGLGQSSVPDGNHLAGSTSIGGSTARQSASAY
jgi:hypothetical protein